MLVYRQISVVPSSLLRVRVYARHGEQPPEELDPRRSMAVPDEARVGGGNPAETAELVEGSGHELIFWTGAAGEGAIVRPGTECHHVQGGAEGGQLRSPHAGEAWSQDVFHAGIEGVGDGGLRASCVGEECGDVGRERTHREPGVVPE
jgi:hypothetical protein